MTPDWPTWLPLSARLGRWRDEVGRDLRSLPGGPLRGLHGRTRECIGVLLRLRSGLGGDGMTRVSVPVEAPPVSVRSNRAGAALDATACTVALVLLFTFQFGRVVVGWGVPSWAVLVGVVALLGLSSAWRVLTGRVTPRAGVRAAVRALRARERVQWGAACGAFMIGAALVVAASLFHDRTAPLVTQQREAAHASWVGMASAVLGFILSAGVVEEVLRAGLAHRLARAAGSAQRWPWWALVASTLVWAAAHAAYGYPPAQLAVVVGVGLAEAAAFRAGGLWTAVVPHAVFDILSLL